MDFAENLVSTGEKGIADAVSALGEGLGGIATGLSDFIGGGLSALGNIFGDNPLGQVLSFASGLVFDAAGTFG